MAVPKESAAGEHRVALVPASSRRLRDRKTTAFSTDVIPRTTRAQAMDTLSSMANISGYKGVRLAAVELDQYFPMLMTAAGMVLPARVFVIGAGVAVLQAIATARRLVTQLAAASGMTGARAAWMWCFRSRRRGEPVTKSLLIGRLEP